MVKKEITRKLRGCAAGIMAMLTTFSAAGCNLGGGGHSSSVEPLEGYEVWGAPATQKVLRDRDDYDSLKTAAKMEIETARNEYESAQIILSALGKVDAYTITLSDLVLEGGDTVYAKENITVYNQKYSDVATPWSPDAVSGWYPDCLLPFDAAVKAGENKVASGDNQGLWFSFNTPENQPVGTYKGNVILTVDGEENTIPVSVRVRNITVSEETHSKSMFINNWSQYLGEYGDTQELTDLYIKKMYEYRISPTTLVIDSAYKQQDFDYYAEKAYELCSVPGSGGYAIPTNKGANGIPKGILSGYMKSLAKKSLETKFDLLAKAYVYAIDEPVSNNAFERSKQFAITFVQHVEEVVSYLESNKTALMAEYNVDEAFFNQVVQSAASLRHVTTTAYREDYDPYVDIWCPPFHHFETGYLSGKYAKDDKLWWYGAVSPQSPYPTYHLDDDMMSPRVIGWMQNVYGVEGNIYWAVNIYAKYQGSYQYVDEYYETPAHYYNSGRAVNGDGFLFYPGKKYGIDGPLVSLRLESIRDGYEEYELLYAIDEAYARISETAQAGKTFSATETIKDIASSIYSGMHVTATNATFADARKQLLNLTEFTQSGICFTDYSDNGEGVIEYELYVPNETALTVTGASKTNERAVTGGKMVTYTADMRVAGAASVATFTTQIDGQSISVERKLSGAVNVYNAEAIASGITAGMDSATTGVVNGMDICGENINLLRIGLPTAGRGERQEITFAQQELLSKINATTEKLVFNFWFDGNESSYPVEIWVKYKNKVYSANIANVRFKKGWNAIEWSGLSSVNWASNGEVEYLLITFGSERDAARADMYIKNIAVYSGKGGA